MGFCIREDIDDLVNVAFTQTVLVAVLDESLACVDHKDALAGSGVFLVEHENAGTRVDGGREGLTDAWSGGRSSNRSHVRAIGAGPRRVEV